MRATEAGRLWRYHSGNAAAMARHDYENVFRKALGDLSRAGFEPDRQCRVLDLGCGQRYPFALLLSEEVAGVDAIDVDWVRPDILPLYVYNVWRANGPKRALKSAARRVLFDRAYYSTLAALAQRRLKSDRVRFTRVADVSRPYPFGDGVFDLIFSNAVIEHVQNVDLVAPELARMLKPGGFLFAIIHNYYSLSGGHALEWAHPDSDPPDDVPPWDHLRESLRSTHAYLNRLRPDEYLEAFRRHMDVGLFEPRDVNHDPGGMEGEGFLTTELAEELSAFPRELLLTRAYCVIARRPQVGALSPAATAAAAGEVS